MTFTIKASEFFVKQVEKLDKETRTFIHEKIELIKNNPYRYKKVNSKHFSRVFRIRLNIKSQETRLIYIVIEPNVILACILDRGKDYKDLEKYLKSLKKQL